MKYSGCSRNICNILKPECELLCFKKYLRQLRKMYYIAYFYSRHHKYKFNNVRLGKGFLI